MLGKTIIRKSVTVFTAAAVWCVYSMVAFALPGDAGDRLLHREHHAQGIVGEGVGVALALGVALGVATGVATGAAFTGVACVGIWALRAEFISKFLCHSGARVFQSRPRVQSAAGKPKDGPS